MKQLYALLLLIFLVPQGDAFAQDLEFTQFYSNPLYLNPAFAGSNYCPRVALNYRNQWPAISGTFVSYSAAYDQYFQGIHGGFGILATNDQAGEGTLKTSNISAIYSYVQPINRDLSFSVGFQATYAQKTVDWNKLTFGDMIDPRRGFVMQSEEVQGITTARNVDISAGLLFYGKKFFVGGAAHHLTEPEEALQVGPSKLPMKYTGHAGLVLPVGSEGDATISPNILFRKQQNFQQLNLGMYLQKGSIVGGLWYRNTDAIIVLLGIQKDGFKFGYSYDLTVSKLSNQTAGSHEISVGMNFKCKKKKPRFRPAICPSF
jgi:type IX secretion system PorP/SprF family membrane protein